MKSCGCEFCNDRRYIKPAKYIGGDDNLKSFINKSKDLQNFIDKAKEKKQFISYHYNYDYNNLEIEFSIISHCPACGYVFSDDDYDSYECM